MCSAPHQKASVRTLAEVWTDATSKVSVSWVGKVYGSERASSGRTKVLMVIFGAGASHDSIPSRPPERFPRHMLTERPPLAADLFYPEDFFRDGLLQYPRCKPIVPYLQSIPAGKTVEAVLEELQVEAESDPERQHQLVAVRYYLNSVINGCQDRWSCLARGVTNYVTLLDQLRRSRRPPMRI